MKDYLLVSAGGERSRGVCGCPAAQWSGHLGTGPQGPDATPPGDHVWPRRADRLHATGRSR